MIKAAPLGHSNPPSEMEIVLQHLAQQEEGIRKLMCFPDVPLAIADEQEAGSITDTIKGIKSLVSTVSDTHETVKKPFLECGRAVDAWKRRMETELSAVIQKYATPLTAFLERRAQEERQRQIDAAEVERERAEALAREAQAHSEAGIDDTASELLDAAVSTEIMAERMETKVYTATPSQLAKARSFTGSTASQRLVWVAEIVNISAVDLQKLRRYFSNEALQVAINAFVRDGGRELDGVKIEQKTQLAVR